MTFYGGVGIGRYRLVARGMAGIGLLGLVLLLPTLVMPSLSPEEASKRVREHLRWQLSMRQLAELEATGQRVPTREMAERWLAENEAFKDLVVTNVQVRRLMGSTVFRRRANLVVKVTIEEPNADPAVRYYLIKGIGSGAANVREVSAWTYRLPI
jgi:hypothetical protein